MLHCGYAYFAGFLAAKSTIWEFMVNAHAFLFSNRYLAKYSSFGRFSMDSCEITRIIGNLWDSPNDGALGDSLDLAFVDSGGVPRLLTDREWTMNGPTRVGKALVTTGSSIPRLAVGPRPGRR